MINTGKRNGGCRAALFAAMVDCGNVLIKAQSLEESAGELYQVQPTPEGLAHWKATRLTVERVAAEYLLAIRSWRKAAEREIAQIRAASSPRVSSPRAWAVYRPSA